MPQLHYLACVFLLALRCAAAPADDSTGLRRVAAGVAVHRPHGEAIRAVLRQASGPMTHAVRQAAGPVAKVAGQAARRVAATPAEEAQADLSRRFRAAKGGAAAQPLLRPRQASRNGNTSSQVLQPTISEAQDALEMLEAVRATLEEVSGLRQVSADPVKSRASLAVEIADMEALLNGTDGVKWEPLLAPTVSAARQAYEDLGEPGQPAAANATGASPNAENTTSPAPTSTEPPAMPYQEDAALDEDFPWDDGYLAQYENQTSGDAVGSLPPPPGSVAAASDAGISTPDSSGSTRSGAGPVALDRANNFGHEVSDGASSNGSARVASARGTNADGDSPPSIAASRMPLAPLGHSAGSDSLQ